MYRKGLAKDVSSGIWRERGFWVLIPGILILSSPFLREGFPSTYDGTLHVYRVLEMYRMWQAGVFYPRWAPDLVYGLGYPLFHFNAPLFPWLGALGMVIGLNLETSVKVVLTLLTFLGATGAYRLARRWDLAEDSALIVALAYAYAPFRVRELYWQGDFPQYMALCLLPWTLDAFHAFLQEGTWTRWWKASVLYGLLPLSHNITAMLGSYVLVGYGMLIVLVERPPRRRIQRALMALVVGVGLAAFFVVPALWDRHLVHLDRLLTGHFDFRKHFLSLRRMVSFVPIQDRSMGNLEDVLTLGGHQFILALPALLSLRYPGRRRALVLGAGIALVGMMLLMTPMSQPVWEHVPLLAFTEFPWRWLGLAALPLSLLVGLAIEEMPRVRQVTTALFMLVLILGSATLLYPAGEPEVLRDAALVDMHNFDRETGSIGLTSVGELLPRWVKEDIQGSPLEQAYREGREPVRLREEDLPPGASVEVISLHPLDQRFWVDLPVETNVSFWVIAFPGWSVQVDGYGVPVWPAEDSGRLQARLPAGHHKVRLVFAGRWDWRVLELFSLALWASGFVRWAQIRWRMRRAARLQSRDQTFSFSRLEAYLLGVMGVLLLTGKVLYVDPYTEWFRPRSDPNQPPGMSERADVNFGERIRLLGYHLSSYTPEPGETVTLTLWWQGIQPMKMQYSSFVHGIEALPWYRMRFQSDHMHPGNLPTTAPPWRGRYYIRDKHTLELPADLPPGPYTLKVGLYELGRPWKRLTVKETGEDEYTLPNVLLVNRQMPPSARLAQPVTFGGKLRLVGVEVPTSISRGQPWQLWFFWEAEQPIAKSYTFFVHRLGEDGRVYGQQDAPPYFQTSYWPTGTIIAVPVELEGVDRPGKYRLRIGWYVWPSMEHLLLPSGEPFYVLPQGVEVKP